MAVDLSSDYELSFGGIPFVLDKSQPHRMANPVHEGLDAKQHLARKQQPEADLIDEINRRLPLAWINEVAPPRPFLKGNMDMLAYPYEQSYPRIEIGTFFYPTGASRWACGRFLATSSQVREMLKKAIPAGGPTAQSFKMQCPVVGAGEFSTSLFSVETSLYMLPPRPLAEMGGEFDGLFMVTLVDERYYWQWKPTAVTSVKPYDTDTWTTLVHNLRADLGISLDPASISTTYLQPQQDSQLWTNKENAAVLLDVVAYNVGRTFVRKLDGTYEFMDYQTAADLVVENRGTGDKVIAFAGGDIFYAGSKLNSGKKTAESPSLQDGVGTLLQAPDVRRAVLPKEIVVSFPYYVTGDDPVPHFLNSRYRPKRPSCWYEDSFGEVYTKTIPVTGNENGVGTHFIHTTAKALIEREADKGTPTNQTVLDALAERLAKDYVNFVAGSALDEVYPGTYAWEPEGINDITWTWSAKKRQASCRVQRQEWNQVVREFQHAEGVPNRGVGGPSVAQSWYDEPVVSGSVQTVITAELASGDYTLNLTTQDNLPTQNRWWAEIEPGTQNAEIMYMEATSGLLAVTIVHRGIAFTTQKLHANGSTVYKVDPNRTWGTNVVHPEKMQYIFPGAWTSGGIQEAVIVPQTQTVQALTGSGALIRSIVSYSGRVHAYDPTKSSGSQFKGLEYIWIQNRDHPEWPVHSGRYYDGQFAGFTASGSSGWVAPLYLVNDHRFRMRTFTNFSGCIPYSGGLTSGLQGSGAYLGPEPTLDIRSSGLPSGWVNGALIDVRSHEFKASGNVTIWINVSGSVVQNVQVFGSGILIDGILVYSGTSYQFDKTAVSGAEWVSGLACRVIHRNPNPHWPLYSGRWYEGKWEGNVSGCSGATFTVSDDLWRLRTIRSGGASPGVTSGYHGPQPKLDLVRSGSYKSGEASIDIHSHEFIESGTVQVYFTVSGAGYSPTGYAGGGGSKSVKVELPYYSGANNLIPANNNHRIGWSGEIYDTDTIFPGNAATGQWYFIPRTSGKYSIKCSLGLEYSGDTSNIVQTILTVDDISYENQSFVATSGSFQVYSSVCGDHLLTTSSRISINVLAGQVVKPTAGYFMMHQFPAS